MKVYSPNNKSTSTSINDTIRLDSALSDDSFGMCTYSSFQNVNLLDNDSTKAEINNFTTKIKNFNAKLFLDTIAFWGGLNFQSILDPKRITSCNPCNLCSYGCTFISQANPSADNTYTINYSPTDISKGAIAKGFKDIWILKVILLHEFYHALVKDPDRVEQFKAFKDSGAPRLTKLIASRTLHSKEIECDGFAATWAGRLGASSDQARMAVLSFSADSTFAYPSSKTRLQRIDTEWKKGKFFRDRFNLNDLFAKNISINKDIRTFNDKLSGNTENFSILRSGGEKGTVSSSKKILNEPYFFVKDSVNLYYRNSSNKEIIIGELKTINHKKFKYLIKDEFYTLWFCDYDNKVYNQNGAIIGKIFD